MRKILCTISLLLIAVINLYGNDYSAILENEFGAIKADMARKACAIADYKGNNMDKITNESIYAFLNSLNEDQILTLHNAIQSFNLPSKGVAENIDSCRIKLLKMNEAFKNELLKKYPKKKTEITNYYEGFIHRINNLFDETKTYLADSSPDKSSYIDMYPHGIYASLLVQDAGVKEVEETVTIQPVEKSIDETLKEETNSNDFYKWAFWVLVSLIILFIAVNFLVKKDKNKETETAKKPTEDMKVTIVKQQSTVLETSVEKEDNDGKNVQTGNIVIENQVSEETIVIDDNETAIVEQNNQKKPNIENDKSPIATKQPTRLQTSVESEGDKGKRVLTGKIGIEKQVPSQTIDVDGKETTTTGQPTPNIAKGNKSQQETTSEDQKPVVLPNEQTTKPQAPIGKDHTEKPIIEPIQQKSADPKKWETAFAQFSEESVVVGVSAQGLNHISGNIPCQDCCCYKSLEKGWGIAATSDGAGSAKLSHEGSHLAVQKVVYWFERIIQKYQLIEKNAFPTQESWSKMCIAVMNQIALDQQEYATKKDVELKYLNCTLIVVIHSPIGLLVTHIGDGRAGYKNSKGEWISLITPHKGDECNQTYFLPFAIKSAGKKSVNGVILPESRVIKEQASALVLMSDGLEHTFWNCIQQDTTSGKYRDVNVPVAKAFNVLASRLHKDKKAGKSEDVTSNEWFDMIKNNFKTEGDDKTLLLISFE